MFAVNKEKGILIEFVGCTMHNCEVSGIPITEEWLERFGWVWNEECDSYEKQGEVRMNLQFNDVSHSWTMFNYVIKAMICERIYFVHQLQNLYHALTGEELKIIDK